MVDWLMVEIYKIADGVTPQPPRKLLRMYILFAALARRDGHVARAKGVIWMIHELQRKCAEEDAKKLFAVKTHQ